MDDETKNKLRNFILSVIGGTNPIKSTECKRLTQDPNPEWFSTYTNFKIKMHTSNTREGISGLKIVGLSNEFSFFNVGYGNTPVGPSKAIKDYQNKFGDWTDCITWDQAKQFMAKLLNDSKALNKYVSG